MNQDVTRLEELLVRVQRNRALPRSIDTGPAVAPVALAAQAVAAAPLPAAPAPVAPLRAAAPTPPPAAPTPTPPPVVQVSASLDASVDDLLLEDPFPSVPPPAPPSFADEPEAAPLPLVAVSSLRSPLQDDDVSGVMVVADFSDGEPEELLDDDIVEMATSSGDSLLAAAPQDPLDDLNFDDSELTGDSSVNEEPPASSSRNKIAATMDEALARAAEDVQLEDGREVPLKTPPPESGPQAAAALPSGIRAPLSPDLDDLLEADILPAIGLNVALPTVEQLGQTVELEDAPGPSLELDHPAPFNVAEPLPDELPGEELEVTLPARDFAGGYQDDLMPPREARHDLAAHLQRTGEGRVASPAPESRQQYTEAGSRGFAPLATPSNVTTDSYSESISTVTVDAPAAAGFAPELLARPELSPGPIAKFIRVEAPRPSTFLELLDASLALGSD